MKKHTGEQPIDDLFARKLGNMSLPPSPNGFERLKARMDQNEQETRIVFWRNPTIQRYMTAAACLLLISLFGWLYWPSPTKLPDGTQVAENKSKTTSKADQVKEQLKPHGGKLNTPTPQQSFSQPETATSELAQVTKKTIEVKPEYLAKKQSPDFNKTTSQGLPATNEPVLAQSKSKEERNSLDPVNSDRAASNIAVATEQMTEVKNQVKPDVASEHVLEVTIAEPATLVAARQAAKAASDEKSAVDANDKPEKESKSGGLWQQVKRFKQGEVLARRDNAGDEDRGLLGRAYSGLKQSLEKDKPAKQ
jgi:hypothetical protein